MKIKEFKKYVDEAYKNGKDDDVEFWLELENEGVMCELKSIGQFHIKRDMTITVSPNGRKIYSSKELTKEELDLKTQRDNLVKKLQTIESVLLED